MADAIELLIAPITRTQIVRFAGAGGDFNPMHHDEAFALAAGQPSVFAMGQLPAALLARAVRAAAGTGWEIERYAVRFSDRVWPGDALALRAWETARTADRVELELAAVRGEDVVVKGTATLRPRG
jgi:acyl dehydratase